MSVLSPVKPPMWSLSPGLTEVPELWEYFFQSQIGPGPIFPFWEQGAKLFNYVPGSFAGDLQVTSAFENRLSLKGPSIYHGTTNNDTLNFTDAGNAFWHDPIDENVILAVVQIDTDSSGTNTILEFGGDLTGVSLVYSADEELFVYSVVGSSTVHVFSKPHLPGVTKVVAGKYDKGAVSIFVDGLKEDFASGPVSIGSHGSDPGCFGSVTDAAFNTVSGFANTSGLKGYIDFLSVTHKSIPDELLSRLTISPFSLISPGPNI